MTSLDLNDYERLVLAQLAQLDAENYRRLARLDSNTPNVRAVLLQAAELRDDMVQRLWPGLRKRTTTTGGADES